MQSGRRRHLFRSASAKRSLQSWFLPAQPAAVVAQATTHGTLPWTADYQRRSVLFRYSPANVDFAGGRHAFDQEHRRGNAWPESWYEGLTDAQRAVLEPPYITGLERPVLADDGDLDEASRALLDAEGWDGIGRNPKDRGGASDKGPESFILPKSGSKL